MKKSVAILGVLVMKVMIGSMFYSGAANACAPLGIPQASVEMIGPTTAKAVVVEYDCQDMIAKTDCIVGFKVSSKFMRREDLKVTDMKFIELASGQPLGGFDLESNTVTTDAFNRVMDGQWFGYSAVFNANAAGARGGLGLEIVFEFKEGTSVETLVEAINHGHIGVAEGNETGDIANDGHHLEIIEIQGVSAV